MFKRATKANTVRARWLWRRRNDAQSKKKCKQKICEIHNLVFCYDFLRVTSYSRKKLSIFERSKICTREQKFSFVGRIKWSIFDYYIHAKLFVVQKSDIIIIEHKVNLNKNLSDYSYYTENYFFCKRLML